MEPLLFKPFKKLKETFCREEVPFTNGCFFQQAISVALDSFSGELEVKFLDESSFGSSGISIRLKPKQLIVLRDILAQIEIIENLSFNVTEQKSEVK